MSIASNDQMRGAGISIKEIEKRRNFEYTLEDQGKREINQIVMPMFGKDDIKTFVPKTKV